jgi:hypothetical protein
VAILIFSCNKEVLAHKKKALSKAEVFVKEYVKQNLQDVYYCTHYNHIFNMFNLKNEINPLIRHVEDC